MERDPSPQQWQTHLETLLQEVGIAEGHLVLDCCCGSGNYAIAAAALVGASGLVYAVDSDADRLDTLKREAAACGLRNIRVIERNVEQAIPLPGDAVDFVLLYDIFWYFRPMDPATERLLTEVWRVARPDARISVYPMHLDSRGLERFKGEMQNNGFALVSELDRELVHEETLERGTLLNYRKAEDSRLRILEERIADLRARVPIHSVRPAMIQELEDLEEELERLRGTGS